ncbi:hypothetical protein EIN_177990 [Entamoeba invadens IP1]|uniref:hypothetical protein n=1 Tax=Entamoeba invadens IP1 TaxID=370355 RepID=UPI0002C3DFE0|nr:hypothetical protein EIN_177990 [Entamoeba invadens IP1]ELP93892.1 hypothetical protein EIN_177990 [Entamoeba invadens IP1]|eukprot:XP_004260663.1 hypothetical protein EIN_177990 [Entamoeba invadens IP1]
MECFEFFNSFNVITLVNKLTIIIFLLLVVKKDPNCLLSNNVKKEKQERSSMLCFAYNNKTQRIKVSPTSTLEDLRQLIFQKTSVPPYRQHLTVGDQVLCDESLTLTQLQLVEPDPVSVTVRSVFPKPSLKGLAVFQDLISIFIPLVSFFISRLLSDNSATKQNSQQLIFMIGWCFYWVVITVDDASFARKGYVLFKRAFAFCFVYSILCVYVAANVFFYPVITSLLSQIVGLVGVFISVILRKALLLFGCSFSPILFDFSFQIAVWTSFNFIVGFPLSLILFSVFSILL